MKNVFYTIYRLIRSSIFPHCRGFQPSLPANAVSISMPFKPLLCRKLAVVEEVPKALSLVGRWSCNVPLAKAMDAAAVKDGRAPSKDEIHRSLNVALLKVVAHPFAVSVERILKAQEAALLEEGTVGMKSRKQHSACAYGLKDWIQGIVNPLHCDALHLDEPPRTTDGCPKNELGYGRETRLEEGTNLLGISWVAQIDYHLLYIVEATRRLGE